MNSRKISAGSVFPSIRLQTVENGEVELGKPAHGMDWQMVMVYRGKHCPMCGNHLKQLEQLKDKFYELGIGIIAVSGDPQDKASIHKRELGLNFPVAYNLSIEQMVELGLYISHPRSSQETDRPFAEPGLYVINDKNQVQIASISNAPFARTDLRVLLGSLSFVRNNNYPIRGTFEGDLVSSHSL